MVATPGVSNAAVSMGTIDGVANPGGIEWTSQFLSLAATHNPKFTFQAIGMHWYGGSSLTVEQNAAKLNDQAGAMMQLAEANGIPEVWITEMGSGYDASAATEEVSLAPCIRHTLRSMRFRNMMLTCVVSVPIHSMARRHLYDECLKLHDHTLCL